MCTLVLILPTVLIGVLLPLVVLPLVVLPLVVLPLAVLRVVEEVLKHSVVPKLVLGPPLPLYLRPREPISYPDCTDISSDVLSFRACL
tara:strand:- start:68 stop:331 length:264 start_codon:yes stop_codon:yes gene_type:complete